MNFNLKSLVSSSFAGVALTLAAGLAQAESPTAAPEIENFVSSKSRAEVRAQTLSAIQAEFAARNEADHQRLAIDTRPSTLTRAQVVAEAVEARRLGLIAHGESSAPIATPAQLDRIRMAGLRALSMTASR